MPEPSLSVEPLGAHHDRGSFACGEPALDDYLKTRAAQDVRRRIAQVFIAVGSTPGAVVGYYSLSAASFDKGGLPPSLAKKLPHYPVPAALLGRLAVDRLRQGQGVGEFLLLDAMKRVLRASASMSVYALVVDAKNERAAAFYGAYGFQALGDSARRLFLPLESIAQLKF